ncbi:MAG: L-aspartate oxidase [Ottowia sp.]|nr:L-aspartate oxidase [Ottowia sp.]
MTPYFTDHNTDVLVIGAGAAGLSLAIRLAVSQRVTLLLKDALPDGASYWAQGGIAVALDASDSAQAHAQDTIAVGAGLCCDEVVKFVTAGARAQLDWLLAQGVSFTEEQDSAGHPRLHLAREGGHGFRRIVHADDATGAAIQNALIAQAQKIPNLTILTSRFAIDLICKPVAHSSCSQTFVSPVDQLNRGGASVWPQAQKSCVGALIYNEIEHCVERWRSRVVVLATGGASHIWQHATNPGAASGDGIAMGWRAGCRVANLEFNQFHPTCLFVPSDQASRRFLLTEALRGEGAYLQLANGERFMSAYHQDAELAPRDVVAQAIHEQMTQHQLSHVYLNISHRNAQFIRAHFPTITAHCLHLGFDLTREAVPIVPAAHYTCGGLVTDIDGATEIPGLYAIGEVACTGLHGANRIASNSLLECFVLSAAAAQHILAYPRDLASATSIEDTLVFDKALDVTSKERQGVARAHQYALQMTMWNDVGIVRNASQLQRAATHLDALKHIVDAYDFTTGANRDWLTLRNLVYVAQLIVRSAMQRTESRGLHYRSDYPEIDFQQARDTVLHNTACPILG